MTLTLVDKNEHVQKEPPLQVGLFIYKYIFPRVKSIFEQT
jgi:hypothetical protein